MARIGTRGVPRALNSALVASSKKDKIAALSPFFDDATKAEFRTMGTLQGTILATACVRWHQHHFAEQPIAASRDPGDLRIEGSRLRNLHRRRAYMAWNSYVGVGQMGGQGTFVDPRIGLSSVRAPIVTPKLLALLAYQLSLETPPPPVGSFDPAAARRGKRVFRGKAGCATCQRDRPSPTGLHAPRWRLPRLHDPTKSASIPRTRRERNGRVSNDAPTRALATRAVFTTGAPAIFAVVNHYNQLKKLNLRSAEDRSRGYLKSL